jgi:hypothetical protein
MITWLTEKLALFGEVLYNCTNWFVTKLIVILCALYILGLLIMAVGMRYFS